MQKSLTFAAPAPVSSPRSCASSAASSRAWPASTSAAQAASSNFVFWNDATGVPNAFRLRTYSTVVRTACTAADWLLTAIDSRSWARLPVRYS